MSNNQPEFIIKYKTSPEKIINILKEHAPKKSPSAFAPKYHIAIKRMAKWIKEGKIKYKEDIVEGLENAPSAFIGLMNGKNFGKLLIKVSE